MRLSHLEMIGFKSFSTRLKVKFSDGITAVVGPNGCGKSNIVDAIRWALGEHRATSLRGDRMEDIIFNGTAARKPLGMAEVSLTIDNSEQLLPVEYSEVTITRRYFRSGASEYQINKVPCRLKDITNLLLDTGMGAHAYSIIEQGMVESVVNGSPLERRQLIEEAAGINKYKTRRRLAQRKLEGTEHDLVRIADLLDEVERSVSTLRRQVRKYERYERLMQQMKDVEIVAACHAFQDLRRQTEPVRERIRQFAERKEAIQTRIRTAEAEVEKSKAVQLEKEEKLQQRQDAVNQIDDQIRALEEQLLISKERRTGLEQRARSASGEAEQAETELEGIRSRLARIGDDRKTLETALEQARTAFVERDEASRTYAGRITAQKEATQALRDRSMAAIQQHSSELATISSLEAREATLRGRSAEVEAARKKLAEELASKKADVETVQKELCAVRAVVEENTSLHGNLTESVQDAQQCIDSARDELTSLETTIATAEKEWTLLDRMHRQYEGYGQGVRTLLANGADVGGLRGVLADGITIEKAYETVIAAYLDDTLQYVVAGRTEDAEAGLAYLRDQEAGRASFILLDRMKSRPAPADLPFEDDGIIGRASTMVTADKALDPAVTHLLSRVVLVKDVETALRLSPLFDTDQDWKLLTAGGEVVDPAGVLTGGSSGSSEADESDLLRRAERIAEIERELEEDRAQRDRIAGELESLETELAALMERQASVEKVLGESRRKLMETESRERQLDFERARMAEQNEDLAREADSLAADAKAAAGELKKRKKAMESLAHDRVSAEEEERTNQQTLNEMEEERQHLAEAASEARVALVSMESRSNELSTTDEFLTQENERLANLLTHRKTEAVEAGGQSTELEKAQKKNEKQLEAHYASRRERAVDRDAVLEEHQNLQEAERQLQQHLGENRNELTQVQEQVHQAELEDAELYMKSNEIRRRLMDRYDTDPEGMDELPRVEELDEYSPDAAQTLRDGIQRKVDDLGPINMAAVEEYRAGKERLDFLQQQQNDLIEAKDNLEKTIIKMNKAARSRFMTTFEEVRTNFMTTFQTLFEGGEADLMLEEGDPLETGIEIMARPGGKRLQSLALLSGGETALTAIALLFAIYLVKPSPFCVFDEVDAPLDDANVRRFASALRQFTSDTQFLVVTHNKRTMEAADYLYGITMEEPGLSKMVSVRLEDAKSDAEADALEPASAPGEEANGAGTVGV